jgi:transcriptional regulator with XRE-family HTH domain
MSGGHLVYEARRRAGLTQRELAERASVSQATIARIESGVTGPGFDQVRDLLDHCGFELKVGIAPSDDSDWSVAQANLRLDPATRVRQHQAALRFVRAGQEALGRARA